MNLKRRKYIENDILKLHFLISGSPRSSKLSLSGLVTEKADDDYLAGKIRSLTRKVDSRIETFLVANGRFYSNNNSPLIDLAKRTGLEIY